MVGVMFMAAIYEWLELIISYICQLVDGGIAVIHLKKVL